MPKDTKAVKASFKAASPPASSETHTKTGTILVLEDEPMPRRVVRTVLTRKGYTVLEAADGPEALAVWAAHRSEIELIFADIEIPGELGLQLCQRAMAEKQGLKFIITSGYITDQIDLKQVAKASILFLPKPYPPESRLGDGECCSRQGLIKVPTGKP